MTKVLLDIKDNGEVFFDCLNHSGDHDVCTIASTLAGVLGIEAEKCGIEPTHYEDGHVNIYLPVSEDKHREVFKAVKEAFLQLEEQNPEYIKVY